MPDSVLVGDIGGTNVRFARAKFGFAGHLEVEDVEILAGDDYPDFDSALDAYLRRLGNRCPRQALFAFAGPVQDERVRLTNRDWLIDGQAIAADMGFERVRLVNDYAAMARAIPELPESAFRVLHAGNPPEERRPILVAGPGTGLGMATLLPEADRGWTVLTGEGGHTAFAARTERDWALVQKLRESHSYVPNELVLAGAGLDHVHRALCEIDGVTWQQTSPADIMAKARQGDRICSDILDIRAGATLDALGDAALINGTLGGVVITGGVAERIVEWLSTEKALRRFFDRGPRSDYMRAIPIRLLLYGEAALIGAAALHFDEETPA